MSFAFCIHKPVIVWYNTIFLPYSLIHTLPWLWCSCHQSERWLLTVFVQRAWVSLCESLAAKIHSEPSLTPQQAGLRPAARTEQNVGVSSKKNILFYWGRFEIDNILQTAVSNAFSPTFISKHPIINIPAFLQIMAWRRPGNKPLSEPMMIILLTHIWVTRSQLVKAIPNSLAEFFLRE